MMDNLFTRITLVDAHRDVIRNIVSLRRSQDLFDDLTDDPAEWELAKQVEADVKPLLYRSHTPVIHRPFEDTSWFNAIAWPFKNWKASRFSDGSFGVWYGCNSVIAAVYESVYHWFRGLLTDAGFDTEAVFGERQVYSVSCNAALLDFRRLVHQYPDLVHKTDYAYCQSVGARIHREGHPGLLTSSVRCKSGESYGVFNPNVLSNPRHNCQLTYRLKGRHILVEKKPDVVWLKISTDEL
jgi:hypothetical protein